jgi:uncharacterized protein (DUF58 family)
MILVAGAVFNLPLWVLVSSMLMVFWGIAYWWRKHALDHIIYRRHWHYRRAFPGEESPVSIEIENCKLLPVSWLQASDPWPTAVAPTDQAVLAPSYLADLVYLTNTYSLRWFERVQRRYILRFQQRGVYEVGPVELASSDLFGLGEESRAIEPREYLTVFPEVLDLPGFDLKAENPFGDLTSRRRIYEDPNRTIGVREYHPEDGFRKVHWPASARTGTLQVRVFQPVTSQVMVICLNVSTLPHYWEGVIPGVLEQLVKVAATLVYQGMQAGYAVGLISNGCLAHADHPFRIPPGRSPRQLARLLETLAAVTHFSTAPFEQFLSKSTPDLPFGATLVIISALSSPELDQTLLRLQRYRKHMTLVSLAGSAPTHIPGVRSIHLPFSAT